MKTNFTFNELSKVFATVAKIEAATVKQIETEKAYKEKDAIFDAEFAKYGYTFFGAPAELGVMFEEKCALMDEQEKARKNAFKAVKDFAAILEVGNGPCDWDEDYIKDFIGCKRYYEIERAASYCKHLAIIASRRVMC